MLRLGFAILVVSLVALSACSSTHSTGDGVVCLAVSNACVCSIEPPQPSASQTSTCDTSYLPDTTCCAAPGWPSTGNCECVTSAIYCGFVPGYFLGADGGPGADGCVCSVGPEAFTGSAQVIGATCYPNLTTDAGPGFGTCCMFPASAAGSLGVPVCACATGLHTCAGGGTVGQSCSAAGFPPPDTSCAGDTQVASCT